MNAPTNSNLAIDLTRVEKTYKGRVYALRGISMQVRPGEIFGLLGPNGAGKSTLVKIMMTVVRPTRAEGTLLGKPVGHKPTLARVGYLPENHRFPRYLTGRQTLEFFAALSTVPRAQRRRRSAELIETVGMTAWADRPIGTYSKGMMQRIGLANAMAHDPDLILLDEPTDGVDPVGRKEIRDVLANLRAVGKTIFINSHQLSELEMICDRVAILIGGVVARQGTPDELSAARMRYEIDVSAANGTPLLREQLLRVLPATFDGAAVTTTMNYSPGEPRSPEDPRFAAAHAAAAASAVHRGTLPNGQWIEVQSVPFAATAAAGAISPATTIRAGTTEPADIQAVLDALRASGLVVRRVQVMRPSLEELFMEAVAAQAGGGRAIPGAQIGKSVAASASNSPTARTGGA